MAASAARYHGNHLTESPPEHQFCFCPKDYLHTLLKHITANVVQHRNLNTADLSVSAKTSSASLNEKI